MSRAGHPSQDDREGEGSGPPPPSPIGVATVPVVAGIDSKGLTAPADSKGLSTTTTVAYRRSDGSGGRGGWVQVPVE